MSVPSPSNPWVPANGPDDTRMTTADVISAVIATLLLVLLNPVGIFIGAFGVMTTDACGSSHTCNYTALNAGEILIVGGPILATIAGLIVFAVRVRRARARVPRPGALSATLWMALACAIVGMMIAFCLFGLVPNN